MSMALDEATDILTDSVLHIGDSTFTTEKKHRALKGALLEFSRETNCSTATVDVSLGSGDSTLDMTAETGLGDWTDWQFIRARIGNIPVRKHDWADVLREWEDGTPTPGRPTKFATGAPNDWLFDKATDIAYTFKVTYRRSLVSFTPGTTNNPTINIPPEWLYHAIWWGGRAYLLHGAPGHPDDADALTEFKDLIQRAKRAFGATDSGINDVQVAD